jgi:16S rRNA processing protein RimM
MRDVNHTAQSQEAAGSSAPGEPVFLVVGKLRRPHGVRGEMLMDVLTDFPERLRPGVRVFVGEEHQPCVIHSTRWQMNALLVAFQGLDSSEAVSIYRNLLVSVRADEIPALEEGEYYHHECMGMQVVDEKGRRIGVIKEILESSAHDIFVLETGENKEVLIPAIGEVILKMDVKRGEMQVRLLPGLLPGEDA